MRQIDCILDWSWSGREGISTSDGEKECLGVRSLFFFRWWVHILALNNARRRLSDSYMRIHFPFFSVSYYKPILPIIPFFPRGIQRVCKRLSLKRKLSTTFPPFRFLDYSFDFWTLPRPEKVLEGKTRQICFSSSTNDE